MYCVIQEIEKRKANKDGYSKELQSKYMQMSISGEDMSHYYYSYSDECFERPIKKAYRISIHESYRDDGKIKKRQFVICTVDYYDIATGWFSLYDWGNSKIEIAADALKCDVDDIYTLIEDKLNPLQEQIIAEFQQTEEYKTHEEHEKITTLHAANKVKFNEKYGVSGYEYDRCYDVFGELKNPKHLKKIEAYYKARQKYEEQSSRYYKEYYSNYNNYSSGSSYGNSISSNHTEEDKESLKQFYRVLSKKFHPDANPDTDTSKQMKLLNQLKGEWGV